MGVDLKELLQRHVEAGTVPGAVALLGSPESTVVMVGDAVLGGPPIREDAIFRIQSMTKVVTAVAALRLVAAGRIGLEEPVERWLPELADRRVLTEPTAGLTDTVPERSPITLRHLLTNTSGYGMIAQESPLQEAMTATGLEAGPLPWPVGADEWLDRLAALPLAFQPGDGWRYHHSFGLLGVLLSRVTGGPLADHLAEDLFAPLGMVDTGFWVPSEECDRLPAAYRHSDAGLVETEPAGGGPYAGPPRVDVSHGELVSTARDYARFLAVLVNGGRHEGRQLISPEDVRQLSRDQVPTVAKTPESFFPGFWDGIGWGFGVAVQTDGPHQGRWGWSGGQGTDFFVDPDGTVGVLLTQVELGAQTFPLLAEFQEASPVG
ncbi:serine hydrolase domain-containing protein [uncultured Friedmanniella sp.]|uniref:serine hydrolase domain-containing protein n=1 Tax=uncultured Friedmanniella sp. TaxID=335381 RepID=UPI0035C9A032